MAVLLTDAKIRPSHDLSRLCCMLFCGLAWLCYGCADPSPMEPPDASGGSAGVMSSVPTLANGGSNAFDEQGEERETTVTPDPPSRDFAAGGRPEQEVIQPRDEATNIVAQSDQTFGGVEAAEYPAGGDELSCVDDGAILIQEPWTACEIQDVTPCEHLGQRSRVVHVCDAGEVRLRTEEEACAIDLENCIDGIPTRIVDGLPRIHDFSGADPARVNDMVRQALNGLGMSGIRGPQGNDRIFVGLWYMAWIDETGFYGKMNGLWGLNGIASSLDFVLIENGRPVNALIVGERGDGAWPEGYMGAEHIEYPNNVAESDDDQNCTQDGRFCAQYSLSEAPHYTDPDLPTWQACNEGSPPWNTQFSPIEIQANEDGLRLIYEGPLTKEGDFGGSTNGQNCHEHFLFPDGQRRPVYLQVGYDLKRNDHHVDRLMTVRNPEGNPPVDGPFGFIGGFVITSWPSPHPLKRINRYLRVPERAVSLDWGQLVTIMADQWRPLPGTIHGADVVLGWARQPVTLSAFPDFTRGRAFTLSNHGDGETGDSGMCLCIVHGAIEMGGGLISESVLGGTTSQVGIRRLTLHHEVEAPAAFERTYEAETELSHHEGRGRLDGDGWAASIGIDTAGHLVFGPRATDWPSESLAAEFRIRIDRAGNPDDIVGNIDIYDADEDEVIALRSLRRTDFNVELNYQTFDLAFDLSERAGHQIETRVFWHARSEMSVDAVRILSQ